MYILTIFTMTTLTIRKTKYIDSNYINNISVNDKIITSILVWFIYFTPNTIDNIKYAMYCRGGGGVKIMDNFTSTINPNVMIKIYALNLIDTTVKTISENFENWTQ